MASVQQVTGGLKSS